MQVSYYLATINKKIIAAIGTVLASILMFGLSSTAGATSSNWSQNNWNNNSNTQYSDCTWRYSDWHGYSMYMHWNHESGMWEECYGYQPANSNYNQNQNQDHNEWCDHILNNNWNQNGWRNNNNQNNGHHYGWRNNHQAWLN